MHAVRSDGIHTATVEDADELAGLQRRSSLVHEDTRNILLGRPELFGVSPHALVRGDVRVVVSGGRIVAFATLIPGDGGAAELEDLFVDPDRFRQGLGRSLVEDALLRARTLGIARIEVSANPNALAFYEAVGFVAAGMVRMQFGEAWRMSLDIRGR